MKHPVQNVVDAVTRSIFVHRHTKNNNIVEERHFKINQAQTAAKNFRFRRTLKNPMIFSYCLLKSHPFCPPKSKRLIVIMLPYSR